MNKKIQYRILSIVIALALWQILAMIVGVDILLVSPWKVLVRLAGIWKEPDFWETIFFSMLRILSGFLLAFLFGSILGVLAGRFSLIETLIWPYIVVMKSVPIACFIIMCLIWLSFTQLTVFIAFLIAFPVLYSNVLSGIRNVDVKMAEAARLFRVPWHRKFLYIELPAIKPYLISACSVSIGMAWKSGIAAEIIGLIHGSIGSKLYEAKIYFMTADLFSWTIVIIILSVVLEKIFILLLKAVFSGVERC